MKTFRLTPLVSALALAGTFSIAAAAGPVDRLSDRLDLSDEQAATIASLFEQHREFMHNEIRWRDADGMLNTDARDEARAAREALHQEILAVLDAEQAATFEQMQRQRDQPEGRHPRGDRMVRALAQLDLSDEQRAQVETLLAEQRAQRMAEHGTMRTEIDALLSDEQRAQLESMREAHRAARRESGHGPRGRQQQ